MSNFFFLFRVKHIGTFFIGYSIRTLEKMSFPHHTYHRRRGSSRGGPLSFCIGLAVLFIFVLPSGIIYNFGSISFIFILIIVFFGIFMKSRARQTRSYPLSPPENSRQYGSNNQGNYVHPETNTNNTQNSPVQSSYRSEKTNSQPFCPYCGEKVEVGISFCSHCGANVGAPIKNKEQWI